MRANAVATPRLPASVHSVSQTPSLYQMTRPKAPAAALP